MSSELNASRLLSRQNPTCIATYWSREKSSFFSKPDPCRRPPSASYGPTLDVAFTLNLGAIAYSPAHSKKQPLASDPRSNSGKGWTYQLTAPDNFHILERGQPHGNGVKKDMGKNSMT